MVREFELYHGVVFLRLAEMSHSPLQIWRHACPSNGAYILSGVGSMAGLYIKYSTKRMSPWRFSFTAPHQSEINDLKANCGEVFVALVCGQDGVVVLNFQELKQILDHNFEESEWVSVQRGRRQMFSVRGTDGELDFKIGDSEFPDRVFKHLARKPLQLVP